MNVILHQALVVAAVLALAFVGPAVAIQFLLRRKAKDRARRKSPLTADLLRSPGESLADQLSELDGSIMAWVSMLMVVPLLVVCLHLAQSHLLGVPESLFRWALAGGLVVGAIVVALRKLHALAEEKDKRRLGLDGERAVGEELNRLMSKGALVFHDIPFDGFNVDHLVIAREGLFAVETKGYAKPAGGDATANARVVFDGSRLVFPMFKTAKPLEQSERQARQVGQWLSQATGSPVTAMPVLALPGWYVDRQQGGTVRVYSARELHRLLDARGAARLSEADVQRISWQVEQRCRTVPRSFRPPDDNAI